jgi:hypothetical protein
MDALALLCNLLAEGPATLRILRREGVKTVSDVETQSPERLASLLSTSSAGARRFAGEARMLAARMGTAPLEREEDMPIGTTVPPADLSALEYQRTGNPRRTAPAAYTTAVTGTLLRPGLIEGLDRELCDRLAKQKILTVESLADASDRSLARRLGIGLPRLLDLAYLARGLLTGAGVVSAPGDTRAETEELQPAFMLQSRRKARATTSSPGSLIAATRGRDEDVAGPFV